MDCDLLHHCLCLQTDHVQYAGRGPHGNLRYVVDPVLGGQRWTHSDRSGPTVDATPHTVEDHSRRQVGIAGWTT